MTTYLNLDQYSHESDAFLEKLVEDWYSFRVYPTKKYQLVSMEFSDEIDMLYKWCESNCSHKWTALWVNEMINDEMDYYLYFESQEDLILFYLTWEDVINSPIF